MGQETVYRFEVYDKKTRAKSVWVQMATREAIRRLRGEADLDSAKLVDSANIDGDGFYQESVTRER